MSFDDLYVFFKCCWILRLDTPADVAKFKAEYCRDGRDMLTALVHEVNTRAM